MADLQTCGVCKRPKSRPLLLDCIHSVCDDCFDEAVMACPSCGLKTSASSPRLCITQPTRDVLGMCMAELTRSQTTRLPCVSCGDAEEAVARCMTCAPLTDLCAACTMRHRKSSLFCEHRIVQLADLNMKDAAVSLCVCHRHTQRAATCVCRTGALLCDDCGMHDSDAVPTATYAEEVRAAAATPLPPTRQLDALRQITATATEHIQDGLRDVDKTECEDIARIEQWRQDTIDMVNRRAADLVGQRQEACGKQKAALDGRLRFLMGASAARVRGEEYTDGVLALNEDAAVAFVERDFTQKIRVIGDCIFTIGSAKRPEGEVRMYLQVPACYEARVRTTDPLPTPVFIRKERVLAVGFADDGTLQVWQFHTTDATDLQQTWHLLATLPKIADEGAVRFCAVRGQLFSATCAALFVLRNLHNDPTQVAAGEHGGWTRVATLNGDPVEAALALDDRVIVVCRTGRRRVVMQLTTTTEIHTYNLDDSTLTTANDDYGWTYFTHDNRLMKFKAGLRKIHAVAPMTVPYWRLWMERDFAVGKRQCVVSGRGSFGCMIGEADILPLSKADSYWQERKLAKPLHAEVAAVVGKTVYVSGRDRTFCSITGLYHADRSYLRVTEPLPSAPMKSVLLLCSSRDL